MPSSYIFCIQQAISLIILNRSTLSKLCCNSFILIFFSLKCMCIKTILSHKYLFSTSLNLNKALQNILKNAVKDIEKKIQEIKNPQN